MTITVWMLRVGRLPEKDCDGMRGYRAIGRVEEAGCDVYADFVATDALVQDMGGAFYVLAKHQVEMVAQRLMMDVS